MKIKFWCLKKKRFVAKVKVNHYCLIQNCPELKKKVSGTAVYKLFGHYVDQNLRPVIPKIGMPYLGEIRKRRIRRNENTGLSGDPGRPDPIDYESATEKKRDCVLDAQIDI